MASPLPGWGRDRGPGQGTSVGRNSLGRVTGTPPAVVHTLRETRGSRVLKILKSLTKKKKSLVGCEATRLSSSGSAFLIPEGTPSQSSGVPMPSDWPPPQPACHLSLALTHGKQLDPLSLQPLGSCVHQILGLPVCDEDTDLGQAHGVRQCASAS